MLRDYQQDTIDEIHKIIERDIKNILVQSPTGSGKSVIMAFMLQEALAQGKRILLVAHKIELIQQLHQHIYRWLKFDSTIMADSKRYRYNKHCQVVIASIQSWSYRYARERDSLPQADWVVIDEAHHSASNSYSNLFNYYKSAIKIGFTATPRRLDGKGLRYLARGTDGYQYLVKGVPVARLMEEGHLSTYKLYGAGNINAEGKVKITAGDYNQRDLADFVATELDPDQVVDTWLQFAPYKKTVLYPVSVQLSKDYVEAFNLRDIPSAHIDATTPYQERKAILDAFRRGDIIVLGQHSIIIEGVDVPDIEAVQFIRPTRSMVIWFQAIGRALRPAPNKPHAIVIDHTTTHQVLPMPDFPVTWSLHPRAYEGQAEHLHCSKCDFRWLPSADRELKEFKVIRVEQTDNGTIEHGIIDPCWCRKCNHQEHHQWERKVLVAGEGSKPPIPNDDSLTIGEVLPHQPRQLIITELEHLFTIAEQKGYKKAWVGYKALEIPDVQYPELLWVADKLGYKPSWASYKYQEKHTL
jgi:superfamily II DNA or RNA helicase